MSLDQLRRQRDIISLEADSGGAAMAQAASRLPAFFTSVREAISKQLNNMGDLLFGKTDLKRFALRMQRVPYASLRNEPAVVPPGLHTDLLTYGRHLTAACASVQDIDKDSLAPYAAWLQSKLGNPSSLASLTNALDIRGYKPLGIKSLQDTLNDCFLPDNVKQPHEVPYGQAIRRQNDWSAIADVVSQLEHCCTEKSHRQVVQRLDDIDELVQKLLTRIKEDPEQYKLSSKTLTTLSNVSYSIATEVEFYALLRHHVREYVTAVQETQKRFADRT